MRTAVIIGGGPAGLTAAYELLKKTDIKPIVYEMSDDVGGISKTIEYKGNRIDIGGHRFFSKSDKVMNLWLEILPLQGAPAKDDKTLGRLLPYSKAKNAPDPERLDKVMLVRDRLSRIFYLRRFFDYPISPTLKTVLNLGLRRTMKIGLSYVKARLFPLKREESLEDFFVNRFGRELYVTFFRDYTEKVWGASCKEIRPEWAAQRIKKLSLSRVILQAFRLMVAPKNGIGQKNIDTSLIKRFIYPKLGPGQMWQTLSGIITEKGGQIHLKRKIVGLSFDMELNNGGGIRYAKIMNLETKETEMVSGDFFLSSMPVKELIEAMGANVVPAEVRRVAEGLKYRDFITVGLLVKKLKIRNATKIRTINGIIPDTWIYVQEKNVRMGRIQIFNNWSPYLVRDEKTVWMGLEYFCNEGDELWNMSDEDLARFAGKELAGIDIIWEEDVLDHVVIRMAKTYPAYFGTYSRFNIIREFVDKIDNLFLIGRNGMHRYNNQDHSMLAAMAAVENIVRGVKSKDNIWEVNTESEYHEENAISA